MGRVKGILFYAELLTIFSDLDETDFDLNLKPETLGIPDAYNYGKFHSASSTYVQNALEQSHLFFSFVS